MQSRLAARIAGLLETAVARQNVSAVNDFAMPATPADLFAFLDRLGIAASDHHPSAPVHGRTVAALRGQIPGGHTKNLFLKDKKDALFLVVALEDAAIELKSLHRRLDASGRFSFGSADLLRAVLGVEPGAVTPFAAINDTGRRVSVVLDAAMMDARDAQLSPARQHHDHDDRPRQAWSRSWRPPAIRPGSWRSRTARRTGA